MTDPHATHGHAGPSVNVYLTIFGALAVFTLISFVVNAIFPKGSMVAVSIIMGVAVIKATLVAMFFMHLRWDWGRLFFMVIPCLILATMLVIVLLPDIVLACHPKGEIQSGSPA